MSKSRQKLGVNLRPEEDGPLCIPEIHCLAGSTSVAMHYVGAPTARRHLNAPEGNRFAVSPHPGRGHACRVARQRALNNAF
ncbi:hypothetical protein HZH68_006273 [Vespula germanica]|uniref:Uncharacterized protein n=1 Tax=Vespula germanica TaxID=30212 RepID=A0A834KAJ2_VESGE|nr:hypothetical protein HZH68_006273 [Vespula germanica]